MYRFEALHFSWYNRYGTRGHDAPENIHPELMQREHTQRKTSKRANSSQMLPYLSADSRDYTDVYSNMEHIFAPVFDWIADEFKRTMPAADILPGNANTVAYPFLSVVVNLNVATSGHRNLMDNSLCLVFPIGDFEGGELCLYEAGIVLSLGNGDGVAFPSCSITHFNLHYVGTRASLVLHTDRAIDQWTYNERNGWANAMFFQ
ncbi:hypothetical protein FOMPIDRAFT_1124104 [Fomitopsis schrenkii]|uniref:Uncharacterized protein n=1 Tax=Fomitopsis schrenkii TaxID=2126942 RepID=S8E8R2_FOMSC|nr:hypothetical protein FOMPIDRAFT_1124104 [Fomitopsis schrenkii]